MAQRLHSIGFLRLLPTHFLAHYVYPVLVGSGAVPYDAPAFFDDWYLRAPNGEFSDGITISHTYDPAVASFDYPSLEASIAAYLRDRGSFRPQRVLDIGGGAGHWLDFYRTRYGAEVHGVELSASAVARLRQKYASSPGVTIQEGDVGSPGFNLAHRFDLISAIGVMFHIVEDEHWERALASLARQLAPGGVLLIGGQFGWITQNVLFHREDAYRRPVEGRKHVHKRIRSLRRCAAACAGLRVDRVVRSPTNFAQRAARRRRSIGSARETQSR